MVATASYAPDGSPLVRITWRLWDPSAFEKLNLRGSRLQERPVAFRPTALEFVGPWSLMVAGVDAEDLIVELWHLEDPFQAPGVVEAGQAVPAVVPSTIREVYREKLTGGKGMLTKALWNRGKPNSLFCLFLGDRNLYELTWKAQASTGALTILASVKDYPSLMGERYTTARAGNHLKAGFVYTFGAGGRREVVPSLVLRDKNRDGEIDDCSALRFTELDAYGFGEPRAWRELDGLLIPSVPASRARRSSP